MVGYKLTDFALYAEFLQYSTPLPPPPSPPPPPPPPSTLVEALRSARVSHILLARIIGSYWHDYPLSNKQTQNSDLGKLQVLLHVLHQELVVELVRLFVVVHVAEPREPVRMRQQGLVPLVLLLIANLETFPRKSQVELESGDFLCQEILSRYDFLLALKTKISQAQGKYGWRRDTRCNIARNIACKRFLVVWAHAATSRATFGPHISPHEHKIVNRGSDQPILVCHVTI